MSIATGRDGKAKDLLESTPPLVHIVIPSICCMEALSALEDEVKRRRRFKHELDLQISQLKRDSTSGNASSLLFHLESALNENAALLNDIKARLFDALDLLSTKAEMIPLEPNMLQNSLQEILIEKDPTDNLILHCILNHARSHPTKSKVFLSANRKEFNDIQEVKEAIKDAGIKYLSQTQDFLDWLGSQQTP